MTSKITFWFLFVCVISPPLCAQEYKNLDSLKTQYHSRANDTVKVKLGALILQNISYTDPEEAYTYAREIIAISEKLNYKHGIGLAYNQLGYLFLNNDQMDSAYYYTKATHDIVMEVNNLQRILTANERFAVYYERINDFESAKKYLQKNIDIFDNRDTIAQVKENDFKYIGSTYFMYSEIDLNHGKYNLALQNGLKALELYKERTKDPLFEADAYIMLGRIEMHLKNYEQSGVYFKQALSVYEDFKDVLWQTDALRLLGENMLFSKNTTEALDYLNRSIIMAKENNYPLKEAAAYKLQGEVYLLLENYSLAQQSLDQSLKRYNQMQNPQEIGKTYQSLGELYTKTKNPKKALFYLEKATTILDSLESLPDAAKAYLNRSESYELLNDHKKALADFRQYNRLNDQIFNQTKSRQIEEMRALFEIEKKEQQIVLQEKEIGLLEQKAEISNLQRLLMAVGLLLSIIGFYALRQKMKRNKLEKEKLAAELDFKKKELTTHALNLARKNETLENLKLKAQELKKSENSGTGYNQLIRSINFDLQDDNNWENFSRYFEEVHKDFNGNVKRKYPDVTSNELRLLALLKMNLSSKEIANILNISAEGIKKARYRLRKKLDLTTEDSLQDLVLSL